MMLVDLLRDHFGLTGTKVGCRRGECGACQVLIDGEVFSACLYPGLRAEGKKIVTIEGLQKKGELHPLQKAFVKFGAVQCGFCTPGMIISSKTLLDQTPQPTLMEIKRALAGNLCRCGSYPKVFEAVLDVGRKQKRKA